MKEITTTERTYVSMLQTVVDIFLEPLRASETTAVITPEERKAIFSEIEVILGFNKGFLEQLEARMEEWESLSYFDKCIGDIFKAVVCIKQRYSPSILIFPSLLPDLLFQSVHVIHQQLRSSIVGPFSLEACIRRLQGVPSGMYI